MAKEKNNVRIKNGLRRSRSVANSDRPVRTLSTDQNRSLSHSDPGSPGQHALAVAFTAIERRIDGLLKDRTRIGRDLHDSVLQSLYAIGLNLEVAWSTGLRPSTEPQQRYDRLAAQLSRLIQEVRGMIASLNSGTIQNFDFAEELASLRNTYEHTGRLRIKLNLQPKTIEILTNEEEQEIVNIVREALSNCARHADATRVTMSLRVVGTRGRISIVDDGTGFVLADTRDRGYGLANMEARARKLGGTLHVRSAIGQGTAITVDFSLALIPADL